jgi:peptidoglycan-N-acetylglucosamine deacetylase
VGPDERPDGPAPGPARRVRPASALGLPRRLARLGLRTLLPSRLLTVTSPGGRGTVCLTFDDGPDPEHTPRLLDVLGEQGVGGIFFVIGRKAERHPDLVGRMAAEGHLVGHHSYDHADPSTVGARRLVAEARRTRDLLSPLLGREPTLFRPPFGRLTAAKLAGLWLAGQTVVLWNLDPKDFARRSPEELAGWFARHPLRGGELVLMHDNHPYAAGAIPLLAAQAVARGLSFYPPRPPRPSTA